MKNKKIIYGFVCILLSVLLTVMLGGKTSNSSSNAGTFRRIPSTVNLKVIAENLNYSSIVSFNDDSLIFLNKKSDAILSVSYGDTLARLEDITPIIIQKSTKPFFMLNDVVRVGNDVMSFCGNCSEIYIQNKYSQNTVETGFNFNNPVAINERTFISRMLGAEEEFLIVKYNFQNKNKVSSNLGQKLRYQGGLATDGMLIYDGSNFLYFINYYNSQIIKFDTNLTVQQLFNTIDEKTELPKVRFLEKSNEYKFSSPRKILNSRAAVTSNYLAINSAVNSVYEDVGTEFKNHAIDLYEPKSGKYVKTIYLNKRYGNLLLDMKGSEQKIAILTEKKIIEITLN